MDSRKELKVSEPLNPVFSVTIGAKAPSRIPYAMGSAEITFHVYEENDYEDKLDDAKEKLTEALSAALLVAESTKD